MESYLPLSNLKKKKKKKKKNSSVLDSRIKIEVTVKVIQQFHVKVEEKEWLTRSLIGRM